MVVNIATYRWAKHVTCLVCLAQCHMNEGHVLLNTIMRSDSQTQASRVLINISPQYVEQLMAKK